MACSLFCVLYHVLKNVGGDPVEYPLMSLHEVCNAVLDDIIFCNLLIECYSV